MLLTYRDSYKTLDDLNQDEMRLGGLRINPTTNISSTVTYMNNIKLRKINDKMKFKLADYLPTRASAISRGQQMRRKLLFTYYKFRCNYIVDSAKATQLTEDKVNANLGNPFSWYDNENILVRMLPKNRAALLNEKKNLPTGPIVSNATGTISQNRTYQDLLKNKMDEAILKTF
jgi:hypothetical protein